MTLQIGDRLAVTHDMHGTTEYNSWCNMKARCYNENHPRYPDWGGKGITVCDRWKHSFENFFADMGFKPSPLHTLDRIEGDKGYEPNNCRWATKKEQSVNRPTCVNLVEFQGRTQTITDWALELGIARKTLYERLEKWGIERALTARKLR